MSVLFTDSTSYITRSTNMPSSFFVRSGTDSGFTIRFKVRQTGTGGNASGRILWHAELSSGDNCNLHADDSAGVGFWDGNGDNFPGSAVQISDGSFHDIAIAFSSSSSKLVTIYVDYTAILTVNMAANEITPTSMFIGNRSTNNSHWWQGEFSDVKTWTRGLAADSIHREGLIAAPQRTADIDSNLPLAAASGAGTDASSAAHNWTTNSLSNGAQTPTYAAASTSVARYGRPSGKPHGVRYATTSSLPSVDGGGGNSVIFGTGGTDYASANVTGLGVLGCMWTKPYADIVQGDGGASARGNTENWQLYGDTWHVRCITGDATDWNGTVGTYECNTMLFSDGVTGVSSDTSLGDYSFDNSQTGMNAANLNAWWFAAWQVVVDTVGQTFTIRQWLQPPGGSVYLSATSALTWASIRTIIESKGASHADAQAWTPGSAASFRFKQGKMAYGRIYQLTTLPLLSTVQAIANATAADVTAFADYRLDWIDGAANRADRSGNSHPLTTILGTLYQGPSFP